MWRSCDYFIKIFINSGIIFSSNQLIITFKRDRFAIKTTISNWNSNWREMFFIEINNFFCLYILLTEICLVAERKTIKLRHAANWYKWKLTVAKNIIREMRQWQIIMWICSDYLVLESTFPAACQLKICLEFK